MNELGQALERALAAGQQAEKLAAEVRERDAALKQRDTQLATSQNASEQRKRALDEEAEKLHREKSRRIRLEEENKVPPSTHPPFSSSPPIRTKASHHRMHRICLEECGGEAARRNIFDPPPTHHQPSRGSGVLTDEPEGDSCACRAENGLFEGGYVWSP